MKILHLEIEYCLKENGDLKLTACPYFKTSTTISPEEQRPSVHCEHHNHGNLGKRIDEWSPYTNDKILDKLPVWCPLENKVEQDKTRLF